MSYNKKMWMGWLAIAKKNNRKFVMPSRDLSEFKVFSGVKKNSKSPREQIVSVSQPHVRVMVRGGLVESMSLEPGYH